MMLIKKYDLPDFNIFHAEKNSFFVWQPDRNIIVIGTSNKVEDSLNAEWVYKEKTEIFQRPSGGQAVVLTPDTLVISVLLIDPLLKSPKEIFEIINHAIIEVLHEAGVKNLNQRGISDIAIGERKILGSAIYRKKEKNFYHAVLNISEDTMTFEKFLKHPSKEPDYRNGRSHVDFVTSLKREGYDLGLMNIKKAIEIKLEKITER